MLRRNKYYSVMVKPRPVQQAIFLDRIDPRRIDDSRRWRGLRY